MTTLGQKQPIGQFETFSAQRATPDVIYVPGVGLRREIGKQRRGSDRMISMSYANHPVLIFIIHGAPIKSM
jgi:hypothetical protein